MNKTAHITLKRATLSALLAAGTMIAGIGIAGATTRGSEPAGLSSASRTAFDHGADHKRAVGDVTAVSATSITIQDKNGNSTTFTINASTTVIKGGHTTGTVADLAVGEKVLIQASSTSATTVATATSIFIVPGKNHGTDTGTGAGAGSGITRTTVPTTTPTIPQG